MQFSFGRGVMAGAAGAAVVLTITAAGTGAAVEAVFRLGHVNKVNSTSTLTGTNRSPMLTVTNSGRGTALNLHVGKGHAPLEVNSRTVVRNLNASLLGGLAPAAFVQGGGHVRAGQVTLSVNQSAALLTLPGYGTFSARCNIG